MMCSPPNETVYAVSQPVDGVPLREFLLRTPEATFLGSRRALCFMPVLTTLEALHDRGVIHGSITPDNLLLCPDGKVRLKGFCIAQCNTVQSDLEFNLNEAIPPLSSTTMTAKCARLRIFMPFRLYLSGTGG